MTEARTAGGGRVLVTRAVSRTDSQRKREKTYELSIVACWIEEKDWVGVVSRGGELGSNEKFETSLMDLQYFSEFSRAATVNGDSLISIVSPTELREARLYRTDSL